MSDVTARERSSALVIVVLALCGLAVSLNQTSVVPLLPRFPQLLGASMTTVSWLVTATLVTGAVCAPTLGRLGDMYGKRRMLLVAVGMNAVGSTLCALTPGVELMIAGRVFQGAALGVIPLGISVMRDLLPPARVGLGVAVMSSSLGFGGAIGLPLTGLVAEHISWRLLFVGGAALSLVLFGLVVLVVHESPLRSGGRFDLPGALGLSAALVCLLLAITKGNEWGWGSRTVLGLLATAAVLLTVWVWFELRRTNPLVDLRVNARPAALLTNVAALLLGFAIFAPLLGATQILQAPPATGYGFGLSLVAAGLVLLPNGAVMTIFSPVSARLSKRWGARTTLVLGTAILCVGNLAIATLPRGIPHVMLACTVAALGTALAYSALPLLVMAAVPPSQTAAANSLNMLMRQMGTSSCSAVTAALSSAMTMQVAGRVLPSAAAYTTIFLVTAGAAALSGVVGLLIPRLRVADTPADVAANTTSLRRAA